MNFWLDPAKKTPTTTQKFTHPDAQKIDEKHDFTLKITEKKFTQKIHAKIHANFGTVFWTDSHIRLGARAGC